MLPILLVSASLESVQSVDTSCILDETLCESAWDGGEKKSVVAFKGEKSLTDSCLDLGALGVRKSGEWNAGAACAGKRGWDRRPHSVRR